MSEPVSDLSPVCQQSLRFWQAAQQGSRTGVIAALAYRQEEPDQGTIGVGDGMQLGVHAARGAADQTASLVAGTRISTVG